MRRQVNSWGNYFNLFPSQWARNLALHLNRLAWVKWLVYTSILEYAAGFVARFCWQSCNRLGCVCVPTHTFLSCQFKSFWLTLRLTLHAIRPQLWKLLVSIFSCTAPPQDTVSCNLCCCYEFWLGSFPTKEPSSCRGWARLSPLGLRAAWAHGDYTCLYRWMCYHLVFGNGSPGWTMTFLCVCGFLAHFPWWVSPWWWADGHCVWK